ncbi:hypothetical protein V6N12_010888 [Hibiscus sabdariffa]|uniref:Uncharacterized protein n=1 Tax=Hibiscus sabdariffa TaxID=183260 RepID=A0ABR2EN67_9ROSI
MQCSNPLNVDSMIAGFWRCYRRRSHSILFSEARQRVSPRFDRDAVKILTKPQIDLELARMRNMTPEEAAARAVVEAEAAIAEAEEAGREAEVTEADAEAAQAFAKAAMKTIKGRSNQKVATSDHPYYFQSFRGEKNVKAFLVARVSLHEQCNLMTNGTTSIAAVEAASVI